MKLAQLHSSDNTRTYEMKDMQRETRLFELMLFSYAKILSKNMQIRQHFVGANFEHISIRRNISRGIPSWSYIWYKNAHNKGCFYLQRSITGTLQLWSQNACIVYSFLLLEPLRCFLDCWSSILSTFHTCFTFAIVCFSLRRWECQFSKKNEINFISK